MKAKILFVSDLHKRDIDFTTITGYTKAVDAVQQDILRFIKDAGVTHLISLGDWYDKGYRSINRMNHDRNLDEELSRAVNGNFYICLGNHFFLERDNNPEMYLIQPSALYKPTKPIYAKAPVIRAVPALRIGAVQISFFHFSKKNKNYATEIDPDVKFHVGVYHDEAVLPSSLREEGNVRGDTMQSILDSVYANVNFAVVGHIHTPIGFRKFNVAGHPLPMVVPGSLANTDTGVSYHETCQLPVLTINDDDTVSAQLFTFSLHTELVKVTKKINKKVTPEVPQTNTPYIPETVGLLDFMKGKGYDNRVIDLVEAAAEQDITVVGGLDLLGLRNIGGVRNDQN